MADGASMHQALPVVFVRCQAKPLPLPLRAIRANPVRCSLMRNSDVFAEEQSQLGDLAAGNNPDSELSMEHAYEQLPGEKVNFEGNYDSFLSNKSTMRSLVPSEPGYAQGAASNSSTIRSNDGAEPTYALAEDTLAPPPPPARGKTNVTAEPGYAAPSTVRNDYDLASPSSTLVPPPPPARAYGATNAPSGQGYASASVVNPPAPYNALSHAESEYAIPTDADAGLRAGALSVQRPRAPDPICTACQQPIIVGQKMSCNGKDYHAEHFVCSQCRKPMGIGRVYMSDDKLFCEADYRELFCEKCARCGKAVPGERIGAMDKIFHAECFVCKKCRQPLSAYMEHEGEPYCKDDYAMLMGKRCAKCNKLIGDMQYFTAMEKHWHSDCFKCSDCGKDFDDGRFFEHNNQPYCEVDYGKRSGKVCVVCNKLLQGAYVTFHGTKYHAEHFTCTLCKKPLSTSGFMEKAQKPYCKPCHVKLFG